jgi:hypothetical protein
VTDKEGTFERLYDTFTHGSDSTAIPQEEVVDIIVTGQVRKINIPSY